MAYLTDDHNQNLKLLSELFRVDENFDIICRRLTAAERGIAFFFIDGFTKDGEMQRIMQHILSQKSLGDADAVLHTLPYIEVEKTSDIDKIVRAVLSGQSAMLSETFGNEAILIDARTYPSRDTSEPDSDRVMQGAHEGFVETLVVNTALIRRRIRDVRLSMRHFDMGGSSKTDVVLCYMEGIADPKVVERAAKKLSALKPESLTLGFQSLAELLIPKGWLNPFPKIRTTERPDTAASQLLEGSVLIICDTSPQVMMLPTSIFQYLEQADDYYFPPLTGTYLRLVRTLILLFSVIATPLWLLYLRYADILPEALRFLIPESAALPVILQLLLAEFAIDGLKIASMNTPDMLSNSLSIVGALILGDFAVEVGWLSGDAILYMAFVAIANFAQQNHELGYAFKFMRVITLILVHFLGIWGFAIGMLIFVFAVATNPTVTGLHYLYPLIPFSGNALSRLIIRTKKKERSAQSRKSAGK